MIDQGPFPGFARNQHPTLHRSQKEHTTQKAASVKGQRKTERKGPTNEIVPNPRKSSPFSKKKAFFSTT